MVSITPISPAKTDNQCSFTHTGVEMSDYVTNIAFENKSALPLLTISLKALHNVTHSVYVSVAFCPFFAIIHLVTGNTNHPMSSIVWDGVGNLTKGVK